MDHVNPANTQSEKRTPTYCYVLLITLTAVLCTYFFALAAQYHTYTIIDGRLETTISSNASAPEEVLSEAGISLRSSDTFTLSRSRLNYLITVKRAQSVTVNYAGEAQTTETAEETVSAVLSDMNIQLSETDTITCLGKPVTLSDAVYSGMCLDITTEEELIDTTIQYTPYDTETYLDPTLAMGETMVKMAGVKGQRQITTSSRVVNGEIIDTRVISTIVLNEPINEIILIGSSVLCNKSETEAAANDTAIIAPPIQTAAAEVKAAEPEVIAAAAEKDTEVADETYYEPEEENEPEYTYEPEEKITLAEDYSYDSWEPEPEYESEPDYTPSYSSYSGNTLVTEDGTVLTYSSSMICEATAYCGGGTTATGTPARYGAIAVDPSVIPYGTRMYIVTEDGSWIYGIATAEDCGGAIQGNIIDLYFDDYDTCIQFGRRNCIVYFLD